jgi:UDP-N-acetyl-2-amino-2-deoxyglucuronate dehydrogenase
LEFEQFERYAEMLRRGAPGERIHWVSICTPNHLHDAHIQFALRIGADVICEKPLVLHPGDLDTLSALEAESGKRIRTVLQLRLHPSILALKARMDSARAGVKHQVDLLYLTSRGPWYHVAWKGDPAKSGGITTNIGIHFFDMLQWIFGGVRNLQVAFQDSQRSAGILELQRADVRWFLSVDPADLPASYRAAGKGFFRCLSVDGEVSEFSDGFTDLHTATYRQILEGGGYGIEDARPSIDLAHRIRHAVPASADPATLGPFRPTEP